MAADTFAICYLLFVIAAKRPASPYQVPDRSASHLSSIALATDEARQRSMGVSPGSWILAPDSSLFATFPRNAVYCR
jgi:hypothetical protein